MASTTQIPRLSDKEAMILKMLIASAATERYGLDLVNASQGTLKRGTIYVVLGRMEDKGYVESRREASDDNGPVIPRRLYKPTGYGARVLRAHEIYEQQVGAALALA